MGMVESWLHRRLTNRAQIAAAAGVTVKVYPIFAPQNAAEPFITFMKTGVRRDYNTRKNDGLPTSTFQVNCWDTNFERLKNYADEVRQAVDGYRENSVDFQIQRCFVTDESDISDPSDWGFEQPTYGVQFNLEIVSAETVQTYT
jgi:hypothetical protein